MNKCGSCHTCVRRKFCPYLAHFNINQDVGCIDYQEHEYVTTVSNTTNYFPEGNE